MQHSYQPKKNIGLRQTCKIIVLLLALIISNLIACANTTSVPTRGTEIIASKVDFADSTQVMLFSPSTGQWVLSTFSQAKPENEFYYNSQLYRVVDSGKAQVVMNVDGSELFKADQQYDNTSRRPKESDVVQVLNKDTRFVAHAVLSTVQTDAIIRFQGRAYKIREDRSLVNTGIVFSSATVTLRRVEITNSGLQHIMDRHTVNGTMNAGKSIFNAGENIQALIENTEIAAPVMQARGNFQRLFDAGRSIGTDRATGKTTSTYTVITTQTGKLVTAFPGLP